MPSLIDGANHDVVPVAVHDTEGVVSIPSFSAVPVVPVPPHSLRIQSSISTGCIRNGAAPDDPFIAPHPRVAQWEPARPLNALHAGGRRVEPVRPVVAPDTTPGRGRPARPGVAQHSGVGGREPALFGGAPYRRAGMGEPARSVIAPHPDGNREEPACSISAVHTTPGRGGPARLVLAQHSGVGGVEAALFGGVPHPREGLGDRRVPSSHCTLTGDEKSRRLRSERRNWTWEDGRPHV